MASATPYSETLPGLNDLPDEMNDLLREWDKKQEKIKQQIAKRRTKKKK